MPSDVGMSVMSALKRFSSLPLTSRARIDVGPGRFVVRAAETLPPTVALMAALSGDLP